MRHRQQANAREDKRMARVITKCGQIHSHSESCLRHEDCSFPPHLHSRICLLQTKGIATIGKELKNKVILILCNVKDGNALTCAICIDLVTDIDEFLTSDTTEDQIVQFVEQVHFYLFPLTLLGLRTICLS